MTDIRSRICEALGAFSPVFNAYEAFVSEKIKYDPSELSVRGNNDRQLFSNAESGFKNYIIERERTKKSIMLNKTTDDLFHILTAMLGTEKMLLYSFQAVFLTNMKIVEKEAYDVYCKAFNGYI
ncbi:MAG: hypothetical protein E7477_00930 [Ruminococcaceae bacterium]|nr:hypothetical protein [Oscillospiraceae bacterium]